MCECAERLTQARHELEVQWGKGQLDMGKLRGLLTNPHVGEDKAMTQPAPDLDDCTCDYFEMLKPDGHVGRKKAYRLERYITTRDIHCRFHNPS